MPKPQHVHEIYIRTTPERLWQALTDPELTQGYYYGCAVGSTWEPGAPYAYVDGPGDGRQSARSSRPIRPTGW